MAKFTPDQLKEQMEQTVRRFRESPESWMQFLDTAARLYKYDFPSQVMIFNQRPDATACAGLPFWNNRTLRRIARDSSGIGVVQRRADGREQVQYLFDISDTRPRRDNIPPPYIWEMRADAQDAVLDNLSAQSGEDTRLLDSFSDNLFIAAQNQAFHDAGSITQNLDFIRAAVASAAYCVLRRCGIDPAPYVRSIPTGGLSTADLHCLGSVTQQSVKTVLSSIEQTMKHLDGCKLFRFTTRNRIAGQGAGVYNKDTKKDRQLTEGDGQNDRRNAETDRAGRNRGDHLLHRDGREGIPRQDAEGVRAVRAGAPEVSHEERPGILSGDGGERDADPVPQRGRGERGRGYGAAHPGAGGAGRDGRKPETDRPHEMGGADEQLPPLRAGDRAAGLDLLLSDNEKGKTAELKKPAAFPFSDEPPAVQLSLMPEEIPARDVFQSNTQPAADDVFQSNTQPAAEDVFQPNTQPAAEDVFQPNTQPAAEDVFHRNTQSGRHEFTQEEIDHVLRLGSNTDRHRECIVAAFEKQKPIGRIAADLQTIYHGGNGFSIGAEMFAAWYDRDGVHLSRGRSARYDAGAYLIPWEQAAERIGHLIETGQFATNVEVAEAAGYERSLLAEKLCYLYHDFSEEARDSGYLSCLFHIRGVGFTEETAWLAGQLRDPAFRQTLTEEYAAFWTAYQQDRALLRFHYHRPREIWESMKDLSMPRRTFTSGMTKIPELGRFITDDEIDASLSGGGNIAGGKNRIYSFFRQEHSEKERKDFLREEYGIGGRSHALSGSSHSWEDHDGKGIHYRKNGCPDIHLTWEHTTKRIAALVQNNRYLSAEAQAAADKVREENTQTAADDVFQSNTQPAADDVFQSNTQPAAAEDVFQPNTQPAAEDVFQPNTQPAAKDVFQLNTQSSAEDVFQSNTQTTAEDEMAAPSMPDGRTVRAIPSAVSPAPDEPTIEQDAGQEQPASRVSAKTQKDFSFEYQLLDRLRADCEYFLGSGQRNERHLWAGTVREQIAKMRELYHALPEKPDWLTKDAISSYERRMAPRYQVIVYHRTENGFDEKPEYQTQEEAERIAQAYIRGSMETGGLAYDGAAVYDLKEKQYLRIYGVFPDRLAQAQVSAVREDVFQPNTQPAADDVFRRNTSESAAPKRTVRTVKEIYDQYLPVIKGKVMADAAYQNACMNSDEENARIEADAATRRAALSIGDTEFLRLYYDLSSFHNRLHKAVFDETYPVTHASAEQPVSSEDVFQGNTLEETVQAAAAAPSHDVFHGNTLEEAVQAAAAAPSHDVFHQNTQPAADDVFQSNTQPAAEDEMAASSMPEGRTGHAIPPAMPQATVENPYEPYSVPYIFCEWSESPVFEDGKRYSIYEFDRLMKQADDEQVAGKNAALKKYGTWEDWYEADDPENARFLGYDKTKFTIVMPDGQTYTERQDIGDGDGGVLDFLSRYPQYQSILQILQQAAAADPSRDVFQSNTQPTDEDVFHQNTQPVAEDVFHRNTQPTAEDVFQSNTQPAADDVFQSNTQSAANDVFQSNTQSAAEDVFHRNTQPSADDVFQRNTLEEAVQAAAADPSHDVFQGNTLEETTQAIPAPHDPLAPAYQVGTVVYWNKAAHIISGVSPAGITLKEAGAEGTELPPIAKAVFEGRLSQDARNTPVIDTLTMDIENTNDDLRETLTGEHGLLSQTDKDAIARRLRRGQGNTEIAQYLSDAHAGTTGNFTLLTGDEAEYIAAPSGFSVEIQDRFGTELSYSWIEVARLCRSLYQQELDGFRHAAPEPAASADVFQPNTPEGPARNAGNYHITDDLLGVSRPRERYRDNIAALRLLHTLEQENRPAAPDEQAALARYTGWGAIPQAFDAGNPAWADEYTELKALLADDEYKSARASTLNAHYTSPTVIRAIYDAVEQMGLAPESILEPSCGIGNFFGMLPEGMRNSRLYGVELDSISGRIAQKLYPGADITVSGFENTAFPDNAFDLAVGNVPFGDYHVNDKAYNKDHLLIHDYFFIKSLDKVKPNGVVAFITSKGTMDKKDVHVRRLLAQKADLLGAIRLPNNAFKANAGAEVTTDILFLQKRETPPETEPEWVQLGQNPDGLSMNRYFISHPEMILGEMKMESTRYGYDATCAPVPGADLKGQLAEAVRHIKVPELLPIRSAADVFQWNTSQNAGSTPDEEVEDYSYFIKDGAVFFRAAGRDEPTGYKETASQRARGMIGLRKTVRDLIIAQTEGCDDDTLHGLQRTLNGQYDAFVKKHGYIHDTGNRRAFSRDAGYPLLLALEELDDEQNVKGKSDIFTQRTIRPHVAATSADTPQDALGLSLAERGKIDFAYMSRLLGGTPEGQIISALHGQIFREPVSGEWQPADEYLSGNIREKLRTAQAYAEKDPAFSFNAKVLESVLPEPLTASDISVRLGTAWIPPEDITQFVREVLHPPFYAANKITVSYSDAIKSWYVSNKGADNDCNSFAHTKFGTSRANGYELLERALNLRDVQIYDVKIVDGKEKRVPNQQETIKARGKQDALRQAFRDWIFADPERRERLVRYYNEHFNHTRPRTYNGDYLSFPGMNPNITLKEHQRNAVARILYGGNTLLAHCVGAGKTWTMAAGAMELRRLGLAHKPMFVVPNSLTEQWGAEFQQLYPGAHILVAREDDLSKQNRPAFCARIATGDYDAVIIGHSQFEKIPLSPEHARAHIEKQLDTLELSLSEAKKDKGQSFTIKQLESSKKKLEARLEQLMNAKEKDNTVSFEQLGVDRIFVDEADEFKNLGLFTKMRNVAGIQTTAAQKSEDMAAKCEYLNGRSGYNSVVFATGTPISNSMTELYTMMRYLQYDVLEQAGLSDFDSWASAFGETVTAMELSPEGSGYRSKTRFAKFVNLPELVTMWKLAADIQTADMLHLPRPEGTYHNELTAPTPEQEAMVKNLGKRADAVRAGAVAPYEDNMLAITNDGRKLALDQRLADPSLPDVPESKLNKVVQNVFEIWERTTPEKGTQLIFCDLATPGGKGARKNSFCAYDDIRDKLIARGVPAEEIAYIHHADTTPKKRTLRRQMNAGKVRILIGSTSKMGAGFNVQKRLAAEHEVDCPWRPRDIEQREGRILRQGNMYDHVDIYRYATQSTFDSYNWQTVENKQKFIAQIVTGKSPARTCEDVDAAALSYAEIKALSAGDPRIKERMELEVEVNKLNVLRTAYKNEQYHLQDEIRMIPDKISDKEHLLAALRQDGRTFAAHHAESVGDTFRAEISGTVYTQKEDAGNALLQRIESETAKIKAGADDAMAWEKSLSIGHYCGFELYLTRDPLQNCILWVRGETKRQVEAGMTPQGMMQRLGNALSGIEEHIPDCEKRISLLKEQLKTAKAELDKPWPQEDEYQIKVARLGELNFLLSKKDDRPQFGLDQPQPELTL